MRVGQIGEISVVWARMGSSSSPGASLESVVLSDAPKNFAASLNPTTNPYVTFKSDQTPLEALGMRGVRPDFEAMSKLVPANSTPEAPAEPTAASAESTDSKDSGAGGMSVKSQAPADTESKASADSSSSSTKKS